MPLARPAAALPTDRKPVGDNVMPAGSGVPLGETPNIPPLRTPAGNVLDKSNALPVSEIKYGAGLTLQG